MSFDNRDDGFRPTTMALHEAMMALGGFGPRGNAAASAVLQELRSLAWKVGLVRKCGETDAEDAVQTLMLRLVKARRGESGFQPESEQVARAYLARALLNLGRDMMSGKRHHEISGEDEDGRWEIPDPGGVGGQRALDQVELVLKAESFVFETLAKRSVQSLATNHRDARSLSLSQLRRITWGELDRAALADQVSEETGEPRSTVYGRIQRGHRRAMEGVEAQCRAALERGELEPELQDSVDDFLQALGSPRICALWPAEQLVFDTLVAGALEAERDPGKRAILEAGLSDIRKLYRSEANLTDLARELARAEGVEKQEARNLLEKRQSAARKALARVCRAGLESRELEPGRLAGRIDQVLHGLGLEPLCHAFLAEMLVFERLAAETVVPGASGRKPGGTVQQLRQTVRGSTNIEELARHASARDGSSFTEALAALKDQHHAAVRLLMKRCRRALGQGAVQQGLEVHVDRLFERMGGAPVCALWRAEELVFGELVKRSARELTTREIGRRAPLLPDLQRIAAGLASLDEIVQEHIERSAAQDWKRGSEDVHWSLGRVVDSLMRACRKALDQGRIPEVRRPAIDEIFVRMGGSRVCDAWASEQNAAGSRMRVNRTTDSERTS
jgi:hypothetical protein